MEHYGFQSSRIRPGESHENGVVEKAHHLLKSALEQALLLRGIRDFPSVEAYMVFVGQVVEETFHRGREARLAEERAALKPLPSSRVPEYTRVVVQVRKWSTILVGGNIYSVPSRLIGHEVEAWVYADVVELRYANKTVDTMPRLRGKSCHRIDYRHVSGRWCASPAPSPRTGTGRTCSLRWCSGGPMTRSVSAPGCDRADVEYVRVLHLAASTGEHAVEQALSVLLERARRSTTPRSRRWHSR